MPSWVSCAWKGRSEVVKGAVALQAPCKGVVRKRILSSKEALSSEDPVTKPGPLWP